MVHILKQQKAVNSPTLKIGRKVNIAGPVSFSLYPGQMTKVIQGHRLRSNQYLLARVYDAAAAEDGRGGNTYIREAVTLERLEYAILKDENGNKRYMHGPAVVFPEPTETFVETPKGGNIFRALELSPISGIYVKVIAAYDDTDAEGKTVHHPIGEELFITGNDQMIYYPRPEHAMIQYDGKYMHHAIAIPEGEGRYILNRLTGEITTVTGPKMYPPDPRTEVVVKRKLTAKECRLFYPGNNEVLAYNDALTERTTEKNTRKGQTNSTDVINNAYATSNQADTLAIFEANANISRGVSYTKPRTITLDTKYDGVVAINVWTGYAINVTSKTGKREVVVGPTTRLLDYDETLEYMELSTGRPKNTDHLLETAYLRVENNKISDLINVQTQDFVDVQIKVSYCLDFLEDYKDKWFSVENYVKYMCDRQRSLLKREAKKHTIEDFYSNATDIVRKVALALPETDSEAETAEPACGRQGRFFPENGMLVHDVEVLSIGVEANVARILEAHQTEMIQKTLELSDATRKMEVVTQLAAYEKQENELKHQNDLYALELKTTLETEKMKAANELAAKKRTEEEAVKQAEADMQKILDTIQSAKLARNKAEDDAKIATEKELAAIEKTRQDAYAATVADIMKSISPDLIAALTSKSNADMLATVSESMSPYAIANGESVSDTVNRLMRGTSLEGILDGIAAYKTED